MKKKKKEKRSLCASITAVCAAVCAVLFFAAVPCRAGGESGNSGDNTWKIAGNYICFEEEEGRAAAGLKKGILTIRDGRITGVGEYVADVDGIVYLDDACVMFPGLLDLHSHVEYSSLQLWTSTENDLPWDNRFEWIRSGRYQEELRNRQAYLADRWDKPFEDSSILIGDAAEYFAEAQAAAGGTTLLQGYNQTEAYDMTDSHEKAGLIRETCRAKDLGLEEGHEPKNIIRFFAPDVFPDMTTPDTYLPMIDTSGWKVIVQPGRDGEKDLLSVLLEEIRKGTSPGYLIHLAEGRAGNLSGKADAYSVLEYQKFKEVLLAGIERGDFTADDVRNAHITLIHGCGIDLKNSEDYGFIRDCGIGLIWSPVSNLLLYGDMPGFYNYLGDDSLLVGIGSDWSPSGSKTVWEECKFAYSFMEKHADTMENCAENLLKACTCKAARMIGNSNVGNIRTGTFADLFILRGREPVNGSRETALKTFIETDDTGVVAVIKGGEPVYAEAAFLKAAGCDEALYGKPQDSDPRLHDKYFLVPTAFEGCAFEELYREFMGVIEDARIDFSRLRTLEDPVYKEKMHSLEEEYCR